MKKLFILLLLLSTALLANINLIKKENPDSNATLLIIGGIHGNEPGGYSAASILASHYKINSKNLWIIPNLNKESIIHNKRGIHGDMNRKFASIKKNDKDRAIVQEVKKIILSKNVSLVLNLHDGHGFYRKKNQNSIFNPNAWGQTCVIDQCKLNNQKLFGNLNTIASTVRDSVNSKLLEKHHIFNVKNTHTKYKDEAMQLSLTYFAVTHSKPAFAIETSKNLSKLSQKVFYQLLAIEEYMKIMDINYTRDFELNEKELRRILHNYGTLRINNNILLNLSNIKKSLSFIPLKSKNNVFNFSHPLGEIRKRKGRYVVFIGSKAITSLKPQYFKLAKDCQENLDFTIDNKEISQEKTTNIYVNVDFSVKKNLKQRVNVIGFQAKGHKDEAGLDISLSDMNKHYSVDKNHKVYRVEFYNKDEFCSTTMVHFK